MTKQAAQKRSQGFDRFTEAARNAVVAAQNEAHAAGSTEITPAHLALELTFREAVRLDDETVGTGHILLALLEADGGSGPVGALGLDKGGVEAFLAAERHEADAADHASR